MALDWCDPFVCIDSTDNLRSATSDQDSNEGIVPIQPAFAVSSSEEIDAVFAKSPTQSEIQRFKCVSFDLQPSVLEILSRHDLSVDELNAAWYRRFEMNAMVAAAMEPDEVESEACSLRGLEKFTNAGSTRLEIHRVQVVAAVLREQQRQSQLSGNQAVWRDDLLLAEASKSLSHECQELAYIQGYNDEVDAYAGTSAIQTDKIELPKPGLFTGLAKQMRVIADLAFLENQSKSKRSPT